MSKGKRNRLKKQQKGILVDNTHPIEKDKLKDNYSYWVTGYYWNNLDVILIEPFCCVKGVGGYRIINLDPLNDFYEVRKAKTLLKDYWENTVFFEDRVSALRWIENIEKEKYLLDNISNVFDHESMKRYIQGKEEYIE